MVLFPLHIVSTVCFGIFPATGRRAGTQTHPSGRCPAAVSTTFSPSPQSRPIPSMVLLLPGQSHTTPSSWEVSLTTLGTEVEIKAAANFSHGAWHKNSFHWYFKYYTNHNSLYVCLSVAVSGALTAINAHKYLAAITHQKCHSQEVESCTHSTLSIIFHFH